MTFFSFSDSLLQANQIISKKSIGNFEKGTKHAEFWFEVSVRLKAAFQYFFFQLFFFPFSNQSHAGKVVMRHWFERNKHIFPASRWEPYDPEKKWDKYTVSQKSILSLLWGQLIIEMALFTGFKFLSWITLKCLTIKAKCILSFAHRTVRNAHFIYEGTMWTF